MKKTIYDELNIRIFLHENRRNYIIFSSADSKSKKEQKEEARVCKTPACLEISKQYNNISQYTRQNPLNLPLNL